MPIPKRTVVSLLRKAARWLDKQPANAMTGACKALAFEIKDRYGRFTERADEAAAYFNGLLSLYEEDAPKHGPSVVWWGMNFAVDAEVAKSGRILMLLFLAEMVERGDL